MIPHRDNPPATLPADALELWPALVDELAARGTIQRITARQLAIFAQLLAQFHRVTGFLNSHGQVLETRNEKGEVKRQEIAPEALQQLKLVDALTKIEKHYGLIEPIGKEETGDPLETLRQSLAARLAQLATN